MNISILTIVKLMATLFATFILIGVTFCAIVLLSVGIARSMSKAVRRGQETEKTNVLTVVGEPCNTVQDSFDAPEYPYSDYERTGENEN